MTVFVVECGEDGVAEVLFDGFAVALVEIAGPVVGGSLGAHVVACSGEENKVVYGKIMVIWGSE